LGTTTLQKAVANIAQSIIAEFVNLGAKMVTNWIASELSMTTVQIPTKSPADSEMMSPGDPR